MCQTRGRADDSPGIRHSFARLGKFGENTTRSDGARLGSYTEIGPKIRSLAVVFRSETAQKARIGYVQFTPNGIDRRFFDFEDSYFEGWLFFLFVRLCTSPDRSKAIAVYGVLFTIRGQLV